ncbi:hypothetical protein RDWZM_005666 [Blomia tropicalis]|uniref:Protein kinase domain-containing protein n=1 Tax=Blomia tropicalis TaxID=40697 RepID=A0A9Q0M6M2_BLOTA|nr:hypothetical protein RDWZM_005666 [Blomia tropicalis]
MKEIKRKGSELPEMTKNNNIQMDPHLIPSDDVEILSQLGMCLDGRLKRGRYGVVYKGHFLESFSLDQLRSSSRLSYAFVRPEPDIKSRVQAGRYFAIKFCDIECRAAIITDVEQRMKQEIHFFEKVRYEPSLLVVRAYFMFSTKKTRYYIVMELADDNMQCVITSYTSQNRLLQSNYVLALYKSLIVTIRQLHQQRLTYGMLQTSNILVFNENSQESNSSCVPFRIKIADFVRSVDMDTPGLAHVLIDDAIEEDLDDIYHLHAEFFTLSQFDIGTRDALKESLKFMTDINAHRNSLQTLDMALELLSRFSVQEQQQR